MEQTKPDENGTVFPAGFSEKAFVGSSPTRTLHILARTVRMRDVYWFKSYPTTQRWRSITAKMMA
jgi:hypothetical protein